MMKSMWAVLVTVAGKPEALNSIGYDFDNAVEMVEGLPNELAGQQVVGVRLVLVDAEQLIGMVNTQKAEAPKRTRAA
jgi:hypothetical protein